MNRFNLLAAAVISFTAVTASGRSESQPNIVFFLVDDLGWKDLGSWGSPFHETPAIDRLTASGMKFTSAYAACPVCSPTRASLLTGRHPVRIGITDWIPGMPTSRVPNPRFRHVQDRDELPLEEVTLAEILQQHGYQACFVGKWHLGGEGFLPTDQGFDVNIGGFHAGSPPGGYHAPWSNPYLEAYHDGEYLTDRLTDESIRFIRSRDTARPFLLYLSYYNVHTPIEADRQTVAHFRCKVSQIGPTPDPVAERRGETRIRQDNADYASMVAAVDRSVGRILEALNHELIADDTVVCFFSDNGGLTTLPRGRPAAPTSNAPLRAGKGWLYEGGIREPMIIRAPEVTKPGSVCDEPVCSMDFLPTLLELTGLSPEPDLHRDGVSLVPLLSGDGSIEPRSLYWHYPHYHGSAWTPGAAVRDGRWKLIEFYEFDDVELYDLQSDVRERSDLSRDRPEQTAWLREKLRRWQSSVSAQMPQPNPNWQLEDSDH